MEYYYLFIAALAIMVLGMIVQSALNANFRKYSRIRTVYGKSAKDVAQEILYRQNCQASIVPISGNLTDNFNPRTNTISLSQPVYNSDSIAAVAVAVHELGHAMQYKEGYSPIAIRNAILPFANIGASFAPIIVIVGLFFSLPNLAMIGVCLYAAVLAFQLVTLPVEFNASHRAMTLLTEGGYIQQSEAVGARKVLSMAAMTYVVNTLATLVSLLRLMLIASGSRRND